MNAYKVFRYSSLSGQWIVIRYEQLTAAQATELETDLNNNEPGTFRVSLA